MLKYIFNMSYDQLQVHQLRLQNKPKQKPFLIFTVRQRSFGKVIFSVVSVCLASCSGGGGCPCKPPPDTHAAPPIPDIFKLGYYLSHTVGKPTDSILLKCLLVKFISIFLILRDPPVFLITKTQLLIALCSYILTSTSLCIHFTFGWMW